MSGGGGGGSQQTTSTGTTYSSNLPEYAKPYYEELLKQGGKQVYSTDSSGYVTGVKSQVPYQGDRLAGFTPQQQNLQRQVAGINPNAPGYDAGLNAAANAGNYADFAMRGIERASGYTPGTITDQTVRGPAVSDTFRDQEVSDTFRDQVVSDTFSDQVVTDDTLATDVFSPGAAAYYNKDNKHLHKTKLVVCKQIKLTNQPTYKLRSITKMQIYKHNR